MFQLLMWLVMRLLAAHIGILPAALGGMQGGPDRHRCGCCVCGRRCTHMLRCRALRQAARIAHRRNARLMAAAARHIHLFLGPTRRSGSSTMCHACTLCQAVAGGCAAAATISRLRCGIQGAWQLAFNRRR